MQQETNTMKRLLDKYIFSDRLRYENHRLIYGTTAEERIEIGGFMAAAVLGALLFGQDEGQERGIMLNTREGRKEFFERYEDEMLHENGGFFTTEVQTLSEAYIELIGETNMLLAICGNDRLYDLAFGLTVDYMQKLVAEEVREHIYDLVPWSEPFAQWLYDAGFVETRRQKLLAMDWSNPEEVYALAEIIRKPKEEAEPTFVFNGLSANEVFNGYWEWLWNAVQTDANLYPDAKTRLVKLKQLILENETHYDFLQPEMNDIAPEHARLFDSWMTQWADFVTGKIKPEKKITFWTKDVTEEQQEKLLDYLKIQEREPQRYKCLTIAVYSLSQLGYISYNITPASIAKWLSERLQNDYSTGTGLSQFRRAWNELRRYHPAVQDEVKLLAELGVLPME